MVKNNSEKKEYGCVFCGQPLSNSILSNIIANGLVCNVSECPECKISMTHPFPSDEEINSLYSSENYRTSDGTRFNFFVEYLIYLASLLKKRAIEKYVHLGKILDIGCGRGLFLDIMRRGGWDVVGVELNKETASYAKNAYGINVYTGNIIDQSLPSESFDVVNICAVLEHLKEPNALLSEARRLLKKEGLLVILVPNIQSFEFKFGGDKWFHLDLPFHLFHFSENSLINLLRKKGFSLKRVKRFHLEYGPFGWLQTLFNLSKIRFNLFYDLLKSGNLRDKNGVFDYMGILVTLALLPIYLPISLLFSIAEPMIFKRSGVCTFYLSKDKP